MSTRWQEALTALRGQGGRRFWQGLDELAGSPAFRQGLTSEFPGLATLDWSRRGVLRAFGASLALAGLTGCEADPDDRALPYVTDPEDSVPGHPRLYATAVPFAGIAQPVLGVTNIGRPTKLEGNPDHPASRGATDAFTQAALLDLYDPERSQVPRFGGNPVGWPELDAALAGRAATLDATRGEGFRLLTGAVTSPTMLRQINALLARWPGARWHVFEPVDDSGLHAATTLAFGRAFDVVPLLDQAHAVVAFDADPLGSGPTQVRDSIAWSARRRAFQRGDGGAEMMVAEPSPTLTGGRSLDRLVAAASRVPALVAALARVFGMAAPGPALTVTEARWIERAAKMLAAARGNGLVLVGTEQPAATQALGWSIDGKLGNAARRFVEPLRPTPPADRTLAALLAEMEGGRVRSLAILESNPVYTSALGAAFARAAKRVELSLHAGLWYDETGKVCQWHAPLAHTLESWSDGRAADGSAVLIQPLVRPFYDVRSDHIVLAKLGGDLGASDYALVQQTWAAIWGALQPNWDQALVKGIAPERPRNSVTVTPVRSPAALSPVTPPDALELLIRPDPTVWDGRLANNPWAQENPKPVTTLTWDNAVLIAPALAAEYGLEDGDEVQLTRGSVSVVGPVWIMPGQAPRTILVHRGYGRRFGDVSKGAGFDVARLLSDGPVTLTPTGGHRLLAAAQEQQAIDGKDLVRVVDFLDTAPRRPKPRAPSFWPDKPLTRPNWGMSIDLDLCTGCGACVTACIAENNIPMVGREEVRNGRRMHWLRVDRYYEGDPEAPAIHVEPVPCMHCEDAPCEMGCPVNAAVHSPEGLNLQVYNRCVGTRTCSSFCPYKVRRFNWADYTGGAAESVKAQRNPDVTVRARGVMEKCTYCIQRISAARIAAKIAGQPIADGAVRTACQQVCPTGAISFGDIADASAEIVNRKASPRDYTVLEEVNTRPRTSYRARIRSERGDV
jgi:molybdopterin-containing oxidoreductase family iron-sulfur binding subunit